MPESPAADPKDAPSAQCISVENKFKISHLDFAKNIWHSNTSLTNGVSLGQDYLFKWKIRTTFFFVILFGDASGTEIANF